MFPLNWRTARTGNSLIEYVLPLAVFTFTGIVLVFAVGVPRKFQNLLSNTMNGSIEGDSIVVAPLGSGMVESAVETTAGRASDGEGIPFRPVQGNGGGSAFDSVAETAGGLGTQNRPEASSQRLNRLASQLERDGADPQLVSLITRLANRGHEIARAESSMPKFADINNSQQLYDALQLIKGDTGLKGQLDNDYQTLANYLAAHPEVAERYPGAFARINQEVAKINGYVDSLQIDSSEVQVNGYIDPYYGAYGGSYYGEPMVTGNLKISGGNAEGVEGSSNTVCTSGGNTASCVQDSTGNNTTSQSTTTTQGGGG